MRTLGLHHHRHHASASADGARDYDAGETYYWAPGHNLEAVTDAEYIEMTRSEDYDALMAHCKRVLSG